MSCFAKQSFIADVSVAEARCGASS